MEPCDCPYCTLQRETEARQRLEHDPARAAMVALYMRRFRMSHVEALAALDGEGDRFWNAALAHVAKMHGLDEDDAISHVLSYSVSMPGVLQ